MKCFKCGEESYGNICRKCEREEERKMKPKKSNHSPQENVKHGKNRITPAGKPEDTSKKGGEE